MQKSLIYLSSPYTNGDRELNTKLHIKAFQILLSKGYHVIAPLLSHYAVNDELKDYNWLELDLTYVRKCSMLIRLIPTYEYVANYFNVTTENTGIIPSPGCDEEENEANKYNMPILKFNTLEQMESFFNINTMFKQNYIKF